jgi:hypothetical protein
MILLTRHPNVFAIWTIIIGLIILGVIVAISGIVYLLKLEIRVKKVIFIMLGIAAIGILVLLALLISVARF